MEFSHFIEWAFYGVIGGTTVYCAGILKEMSKSISELNEHVAVLLEKSKWQERELERHDNRISSLEKKEH